MRHLVKQFWNHTEDITTVSTKGFLTEQKWQNSCCEQLHITKKEAINGKIKEQIDTQYTLVQFQN